MAFAPKIDYSGLLAKKPNALVIRDENPNETNEVYQPTGQHGEIADCEMYGRDASPTNNFALQGDLEFADGELLMNDILTIDADKFALESLNINTGGGSAVTIAANSQLLEATASDDAQFVFEVPAFKVSPEHAAQDIFNAFSLTGERCQLTQCNHTIGSSIGKDKVAGSIVYSDVGSGLITVSGTILQLGAAEPEITPNSGWTLTKTPKKTNPEATKPTWAFELRRALVKRRKIVTAPAASAPAA